MKKRIIVFVCFVFLTMFFSGCSMMPSDDEIIKGSVVDNEIFGDELVDDGLDNEELGIDNEEGEENLQNENEELVEEDGDVDDGKSEVDVEVVD